MTDLADAGLVRPAARSEHIGAWDEARQVLLIHGGSNLEGDLWAFDATSEAWTRTVTAVAPAARAAHAAGWDPAKQALWVHGGHNSQTKTWFRDVWRFQSGAWTLEFDGAGPCGRQAHVAVWVSSTSSLWVHGGWTGSRRLSDLWSYNDQAHGWQELAPVAPSGVPPARSHHVAVWDGTGQALWMHGGYNDSLLGDLWTLDASGLSWTEVVFDGGPTARSGHAAVWDDANRRLWLHGGNDGFLKRELWRYETGSNIWSEIHAQGPSGRWSQVTVWDSLNHVIYMHGGFNGSLCGDLWKFWVTTSTTSVSTSTVTLTSSKSSTTSSTSAIHTTSTDTSSKSIAVMSNLAATVESADRVVAWVLLVISSCILLTSCIGCWIVRRHPCRVVVVPFVYHTGCLSEPQPSKLPDKKEPKSAPAFAGTCHRIHRSPYPPLIFRCCFRGSPATARRIRLAPWPPMFPPTAAPRHQWMEPQPSPALPHLTPSACCRSCQASKRQEGLAGQLPQPSKKRGPRPSSASPALPSFPRLEQSAPARFNCRAHNRATATVHRSKPRQELVPSSHLALEKVTQVHRLLQHDTLSLTPRSRRFGFRKASISDIHGSAFSSPPILPAVERPGTPETPGSRSDGATTVSYSRTPPPPARRWRSSISRDGHEN